MLGIEDEKRCMTMKEKSMIKTGHVVSGKRLTVAQLILGLAHTLMVRDMD